MISGPGRAAALRDKIEAANELLKAAEEELERAVKALVPVLVGDKRMSTTSLDLTFQKLRAARQVVSDLESSLAEELATSSPS